MFDANILFVDKPKGITSFDVIRILRKKLGIRKMGHAGTLDPLASGLMIIGVNEGTKKMSEFLKLPKVYIADVLLGKKTDTGDLEGRVIEEKEVRTLPQITSPSRFHLSAIFDFFSIINLSPYLDTPQDLLNRKNQILRKSETEAKEIICGRALSEIPEAKIQEAVAGLIGVHWLPVPMYSAIKVGGRPLYKLARKKEKGKELTEEERSVEPPVKEMEVLSARLLKTHCQGSTLTMKIEMEVSSGTYVRSLAEELGRRLGYPATLAGLRRTKIGNFSLDDAITLEK